MGSALAAREFAQETANRMFGGLAPSYDRVVDIFTLYQDRYWKRWMASESGLARGDVVLDVGCGTLLLEQRLLDRGCRVVGIDLAYEMLSAGKAKGVPNTVLMVNGDGESLPFPGGSFDAIVSCYVAKYVDLGRFAEEAVRVLKPGGSLTLYDFIRPTGLPAPFLRLYIEGLLGAVAAVLGLTKAKSALTFVNLPKIIDGATWNRNIIATMEERGLRTTKLRTLTAGVVAAYQGTKPLRG